MKRLMIIDGHAFIFRAYYAFANADLRNPDGEPTGALFGFFRMLFKLLNDFKPSHIAITFDPGKKLERNKVFEDYKANRKPMPEELKPQLQKTMEFVKKLGFPLLVEDGHEADDIIGTLCTNYKNDFNEILIFSGDKDLYQLLDKNIFLFRGKKGVTEFVKIDSDWVKSELGILPLQITDYMGLTGDTSDNIPGVKGIGDKGASKLINEFGNLEGIYNSLAQIKNPSMKTKLESNRENAFLSRQLATLKTDIHLSFAIADLVTPDYRDETKITIFKDYGLNALFKDLAGKTEETQATNEPETKSIHSEKHKYNAITTSAELDKVIKIIASSEILSVDTETTSENPMFAKLLGISLALKPQQAWYIPVQDDSLFNSGLTKQEVISKLKPVLENNKIKKLGQNIKYDMNVLAAEGIHIQPVYFDTMIASYVINPSSRRHNMDDMALDFLGYNTIKYSDITGTGKNKKNLSEIAPENVTDYACEDADITLQLYHNLKDKLKNSGQEDIYYKTEIPLINVLSSMETKGVKIDPEYFRQLSGKFAKKIQTLENSIHKYAEREFNIASTKELQNVLFEKLGLPAVKKTKTGFSTDHSVLEELQGYHPIIDDLLTHRKFTKLKSTYIDSLPSLIHPDTGRIHTSYNQTIAATGRLSSTNPNLQNIPIKDEEGRMIRKGFIAEEGFELLSLDYSQIELRIMAHFSQDKNMLQAYRNGRDIHKQTAVAIFNVAEKDVTAEMRNHAKIVNFSVIYGTTFFGLSQNMKISRQEAKEFIERYFTEYSGVKNYMEQVVSQCQKNGYVETISGRKRFIPDINSKNKQIQEAAKRIAINSPIQGTSADMIKIAMIKIQEKIIKKKFRSSLIMQVHDELVFEVHPGEKDEIFALAKKEMEQAIKLDVPVVVEGNFGLNWEEAH